jgi:hypothetical protein
VKIDPFAPQILIDYAHFCDEFGLLSFAEFIALWHAADALMQTAVAAGFEPNDVTDLLLTTDGRASCADDATESIH